MPGAGFPYQPAEQHRSFPERLSCHMRPGKRRQGEPQRLAGSRNPGGQLTTSQTNYRLAVNRSEWPESRVRPRGGAGDCVVGQVGWRGDDGVDALRLTRPTGRWNAANRLWPQLPRRPHRECLPMVRAALAHGRETRSPRPCRCAAAIPSVRRRMAGGGSSSRG